MEFTERKDAEAAMRALDGRVFMGSRIAVEPARGAQKTGKLC